ncbi:MAG: outer rane lipocarrier protein LolA [Pseudomonadota bacterium]|jgi:outer membrane lipoprotein carrier protein
MQTWRVLLAVLLLGIGAAVPGRAPAAGNDTVLDRFLQGMQGWSARFTQQVVDGRERVVGRGEGSLVVLRPGRFRWELQAADDSGAGQLLVADGRNLWFHDRDLDQVTVRPVEAALSQTPAALLAGTVDLRTAFNVEPAPRADGLEWVVVRPRSAAADFRSARFGFESGQLRRLVFEDRLGQRSTLRFTDSRRNPPIDAAIMRFVVPEGVDVIGTPVPSREP